MRPRTLKEATSRVRAVAGQGEGKVVKRAKAKRAVKLKRAKVDKKMFTSEEEAPGTRFEIMPSWWIEGYVELGLGAGVSEVSKPYLLRLIRAVDVVERLCAPVIEATMRFDSLVVLCGNKLSDEQIADVRAAVEGIEIIS